MGCKFVIKKINLIVLINVSILYKIQDFSINSTNFGD